MTAVSYTHLDVYKRQNLWHSADKFSISSMKLDERILEQGVYTQIEPEKISDIFMEYYKSCLLYTSRCV